VIESFGDKGTEAIFHGEPVRLIRRYPPNVVTAVLQKLDVINAARSLQDLLAPPGNRLEALKGTMKGLHSIRVNDQWRLVFRWDGTNAHEVRLAD
jgi:proteic killer suppression protein